MGSRFPSHQLSSGLYVSGRPEQPKEKTQTMSSVAMPYTGGDIKKSGELGKMFDIPVDGSKSRKSGPMPNAPPRTGSSAKSSSHSGPINPSAAARSSYSVSGSVSSSGAAGSASMKKSNSGPLSKHGEPLKKSSGPQSGGVTPSGRQNSGPQTPVLPTTGLITSGPISSGSLTSSGAPRKVSGPSDWTGSIKVHGSVSGNPAVTTLGQDAEHSFKCNIPNPILWAVLLLFVMGFIAGGFIIGAVHSYDLLIVVIILFFIFTAVFTWNSCWGKKAIIGFIARYPDSELRTAKNGQYIKVSGVVTCGNMPLESSFQKVPRCVYTSTSLYEYRGWNSRASNPTHRRCKWGLGHTEKHAVDFYISDFQSGLRALVKTGYGSQVTPYVDETVIIDVDPKNKELSPELTQWLQERNLSSNDHAMRLKEGYVKEGSTVSVMGVVQRNQNVLMIVPPPEPFTVGCQWSKCLLPGSLEGIVVRCEDTSNMDVIAV